MRNIPNVFPSRCISSSSNQQSCTASYLVNTVGLSLQTASSVSKRVNFKNCEKPDRVISLFEKYGFTKIELSRLFSKRPHLLIADSEKTILLKLEFFEAKGFSCPEIAKMLSVFPNILTNNLDNQIIPAYNYFRDLFQSEKKVIAAVKRYPDVLAGKKCGVPNIDILRGYGVPRSNIATLIICHPRVVRYNLDLFRETVEKVLEMGFDASKLNFVLVVHAFMSMSKPKWESKVEAYKRWGWSEEEVSKAFHRYPWCMTVSEDKLMACMDFFINKMGSRPCFIAKNPKLLSLSLKKRLIPRSLVFQVLLSKGLVKKEVILVGLFASPEEKFLKKFVIPYEKEAPEVLKLYKEKN